MLTIKKLNKTIQKYYPNVELVKGDGYFYFTPIYEYCANQVHWLDCCSTTSVMVNRLNDLSEQSWLEELDRLKNSTR